jgi:hypothetical protein
MLLRNGKLNLKYFQVLSNQLNHRKSFCSKIFDEIKITPKEKKYFYPVKGLPEFDEKGLFTVFEYKEELSHVDKKGEYQRLVQVPYEIKEHSLKAFLYTFFLIWGGRMLSNFSTSFISTSGYMFSFVPASVFLYHFLSSVNYMYNAVTAIRLKNNGTHVILEFKNNIQRPVEIEISKLIKNREENFLLECYTEPFLFPIILDYTDEKGKYSLFNKRTVYLYGDSHSCIKNGEILRAILNSQNIKLH